MDKVEDLTRIQAELILADVKIKAKVLQLLQIKDKIISEQENNFKPELEEVLNGINEKIAEVRFSKWL